MYEPFWRLAAATEALGAVLAGLSLLPVAVYSRTDDFLPEATAAHAAQDELNREAAQSA